MGNKLEEYFVSIGVKGQEIVLSTINKVKKESSNLSKLKPAVDLGKNVVKSMAGAIPGLNKFTGQAPSPGAPSPEEKKSDKKEEENTKKFGKSADTIGKAMTTFSNAAGTLDPVSLMSGVSGAIGGALSGVSVMGFSLGNLPKGLADMNNALVNMASGALSMAKQSASGTYGLMNRDVTSAYYGGEGISGKGMSNPEKAALVSAISGSFGIIKKPLQDLVNELSQTKNTAALSKVASGDWQSTGTDKGWMLQQITNQLSGLPPSIAQKFQTELLKNSSDLIMNKGAESGSQQTVAKWTAAEEAQTKNLYNISAKNMPGLDSLNNEFNTLQGNLLAVGSGLSSLVSTQAAAINGMVAAVEKMKRSIDNFSDALPSKLKNLTSK